MSEDYFGALGLEQALVVDAVELKDAWHRAAAGSTNSQEIHRAYAALRDPAQRIEHLLTWHGRKVVSSEKPGARLFDLFFTVATALKNADAIVAQIESATSALQRAGMTKTLLTSLEELTNASRLVAAERFTRNDQLTTLSQTFPNLMEVEWEFLTSLGNDFTFLSKWDGEIQKRETRLQETLMGKIV